MERPGLEISGPQCACCTAICVAAARMRCSLACSVSAGVGVCGSGGRSCSCRGGVDGGADIGDWADVGDWAGALAPDWAGAGAGDDDCAPACRHTAAARLHAARANLETIGLRIDHGAALLRGPSPAWVTNAARRVSNGCHAAPATLPNGCSVAERLPVLCRRAPARDAGGAGPAQRSEAADSE